MSTQAVGESTEVIDTTKQPVEVANTGGLDGNEGGDDDAEVIVSIGAPPAPTDDDEDEPAPDDKEWLKKLRAADREKAKRIRELEAAVAEKEQAKAAAAAPVLPPKPKPGDAGIDYDDDKYDAALLAWGEKKREIEAAKAAEVKALEDEKSAWVKKQQAYKARAASMKIPDTAPSFEEAEDVVKKHLSVAQQSLLIDAASNPAHLVYALGTNLDEIKNLAAHKNLGTFAVALGRVESKITVTSKKPSTNAERPLSGGRAPASTVDNHLARLEAEYELTGDRSKIIAYKAEQKRKQGK